MREVSYFNPSTGEIVGCVTGQDYEVEANLPDGCDYIEGIFPPTKYYVKDGAAVALQELSVTVTGNVVSGLPVPCVVRIEGVPYEITDGELELNANLPGPYRILISAPCYLLTEIVIQ